MARGREKRKWEGVRRKKGNRRGKRKWRGGVGEVRGIFHSPLAAA